ncbi:hypothetical protein CPC16_009238 [Podila verticillata]|nr:hypothetical protein CPC16_009238 [Podila verticillata]
MSSLAVASGESELDSGPPPSTINAIVPGSIFQDDIPNTFAEGGYDPQVNPPPANVTGSPGNKNVQIEVNSTIQTVLISLGIAVGAMFLLGVVAARFISHKNKRAALKKKLAQGGEKGGLEGEGEGGEGDGGEEGEDDVEEGRTKRGNNNVVETEDHHDRITRFSEKHELTIESSMFDGGPNMSRRPSITGQLLGPDGPYSGATMYNNDKSPFHGPSPIASNSPSFRLSNSTTHHQSPKGGSIIGSVGIGGGGRPGGSNIHGSVGGSHANTKNPSPPMGHHQYQAHHPSDHNPRNTVVDGNIYAQRQGGDLHIGIPPSQQHPYSQYSISPSSAGTSIGNPFASPPISADSNVSGLDPFRTNNNSQASLSLMLGSNDSMANQEDQYASRNPFYSQHHTLGHDYFGHHAASSETLGHQHAPHERHVALSSSPGVVTAISMAGHSPPIVIHGADQVHPMNFAHTSNVTHVASSSSGHNNIVASVETIGPMGPLSGPPRTPPVFASSSPGISPFQTPPRAITRSATTGIHSKSDSRSFTTPGREIGGATPVNEGSAWYRKRASVIIPEGNAHVRLWGDSAHQQTHSSSSMSSTSSSASSSSPPRNSKSALDPSSSSSSPPSSREREGRPMAKAISSSPTIATTHLSSSATEFSPTTTAARNGAAVFEGGRSATRSATRSASRSPSRSRQASSSSSGPPCASPAAVSSSLALPGGAGAPEEGANESEGTMLHVTGDRATSRRGSLLGDEAHVEYPVVTRRRGSVAHQAGSANRQSYLDDYNERK